MLHVARHPVVVVIYRYRADPPRHPVVVVMLHVARYVVCVYARMHGRERRRCRLPPVVVAMCCCGAPRHRTRLRNVVEVLLLWPCVVVAHLVIELGHVDTPPTHRPAVARARVDLVVIRVADGERIGVSSRAYDYNK